MFLTDLPIKTGADIPIPIRETIVTIRARQTSISHVIVQVPEEKEKASPPFSQYHSFNPIRGNPPLAATQSIHPDFRLGKDGSRYTKSESRDQRNDPSTTDQQQSRHGTGTRREGVL